MSQGKWDIDNFGGGDDVFLGMGDCDFIHSPALVLEQWRGVNLWSINPLSLTLLSRRLGVVVVSKCEDCRDK